MVHLANALGAVCYGPVHTLHGRIWHSLGNCGRFDIVSEYGVFRLAIQRKALPRYLGTNHDPFPAFLLWLLSTCWVGKTAARTDFYLKYFAERFRFVWVNEALPRVVSDADRA